MTDIKTDQAIEVTENGPYHVTGGIPLIRVRKIPGERGSFSGWEPYETHRDRGRVLALPLRPVHREAVLHRDAREGGLRRDGDRADEHLRASARRCSAGRTITVKDDRAICAHAAFCSNAATNVWKAAKKTDEDPELAETVVGMVRNCPSGALTVERSTGSRPSRQLSPEIWVLENAQLRRPRRDPDHAIGRSADRGAQPHGAVPVRGIEEQAAVRRHARRDRLHRRMTLFALVHGAWHGAWCWSKVVPLIEERGHAAVAMDLPIEDASAGWSTYADAVIAAIGDADRPMSSSSVTRWVDTLIPVVAERRPVTRSVFLAGGMPVEESFAALMTKHPDHFGQGLMPKLVFAEDGANVVASGRCDRDLLPRLRREGRARSRCAATDAVHPPRGVVSDPGVPELARHVHRVHPGSARSRRTGAGGSRPSSAWRRSRSTRPTPRSGRSRASSPTSSCPSPELPTDARSTEHLRGVLIWSTAG